jgi:hypothetical protein
MSDLNALLDGLIELKEKEPTYPSYHEAAMRVPKGGSSCSNCRWLGKNRRTCRNRHYTAWHGSNCLPHPADEFCSDWWEPCEEL